jgi:hypothetical protein
VAGGVVRRREHEAGQVEKWSERRGSDLSIHSVRSTRSSLLQESSPLTTQSKKRWTGGEEVGPRKRDES